MATKQITHMKCKKPVQDCDCAIPFNDEELESQKGKAGGYRPHGGSIYYSKNNILRFLATIDDLKVDLHNLKVERQNFEEEERHG